MDVRRDILWRAYLSFLGIAALGLVVLGRAFYIQYAQGDYWRGMSDSLHQRIIPLQAERGTIYSDDGQMLSTSLPVFDVYMDFAAEGLRVKNGKRFFDNIDSLSIAMADLFGDKSARAYRQELEAGYRKKSRYYPLKKKLSFAEYKQFRDFPLVRLGRNRSGIIIETGSIRLNPYGLLANRTIGLSRNNAQNVGLERTYDSLLAGQTGKRLVRYISGGAAVPIEGYEIEPINGRDIITNLDVHIQDIAETALMNMMVKSESVYGTCIVMETRTGKIKAIANLGRRPDGSYWENYNYALRTTEPGSTMKLATLLAVLEEGTVDINDPVQVGTSGSDFVGVRKVNDAERSPKAVLTVKECFAHSSNVGISRIAWKTFSSNPDKFPEYLRQYGLNQRSGIDIDGEEKPALLNIKKNNEGLHAMVTMSFGYAIELSPMRTLMLYNAVANNGKMMKPYVAGSVRHTGNIVKEFSPEVLNEQIASPEVIRKAQQCLEAVATEGTASLVFKGLPFSVAGKTGTAHVADGNTKYSDGVYQASFAGYFPANNPEYSCIVVIRTKPHAAQHYGGQLAAPVFREVASRLYALFVENKESAIASWTIDSTGVLFAGYTSDMKRVMDELDADVRNTSQYEWSRVQYKSNTSTFNPLQVNNNRIPDLKGMNLKDMLYLMENLGVKVTTNGRGKVVQQSVPPGTAIKKGMTIIVEME